MTIHGSRLFLTVFFGVFICVNVQAMEEEPRILANPWTDRTYDPSSGTVVCGSLRGLLSKVAHRMSNPFGEYRDGDAGLQGIQIQSSAQWWVERCQEREKAVVDYETLQKEGAKSGRLCALREDLKTGDRELLAEQRRLTKEFAEFCVALNISNKLESIARKV